jgi:hypothetical protein
MDGLSIPAVLERIRAVSLPLAVVLAAAAPGRTIDCNGNSVEDSADLASGSSQDCNSNRIPDECDILGHPLAFQESSFFETRESPRDMTSRDLDGDGHEDLAFVSEGRSLGILLRLAAGFVEEEIPLAAPATALVSADLDGDGDPDLAAAGTFTVTTVENEGAGKFAVGPRTSLGSSSTDMDSGDIDGDGDLDLVTTNFIGGGFPGNVSVLRNGGRGAQWDVRNYAAQVDPAALVLADTDGDGDLDAAVANRGSRTVSFLENDGRGGFPGEAREDVDLGFSPGSVASADLNGDGRTDFAVKDEHSGLLLLLANAGPGHYSELARVDVRTANGTVVAEDTDLDGDPDLIVNSWGVTHVQNDGGQFHPVPIRPIDLIPRPHSMVPVDFDSDGDPDVALASKQPDGVVILGNHGSGAFDTLEYPLPRRPESLLVHDLDGDGDVDILAADRKYEYPDAGPGEYVYLLENDGRGRLQLSSTFRLVQGPDGMAAGDLDGDGDTDVAVALHGYNNVGGEGIAFLIQEGPGSFIPGKELQVGCCPSGLDLADLDGDLDLDLAIGFDGSVYSYKNDGLGNFSLVGGAGGASGSVLARDLNGDGRLDLVTMSGVSLNNGSAYFDVWSQFDPHGAMFACADLDHDGDLDVGLGFRHTGSTPPHVLWNDGAGAFHEWSKLDFDGRAYSVAAADLDGDGGAELLALNNITNQAAVYRKLGGAGLERTEDLVLMPARETVTQGVMALGDMDSDGDADLVAGTLDGIIVVRNRFEPGSSRDADRDGIPDECRQVPFLRGDTDANGLIDMADALSILGGLFLGEREHLTCARSADTDDTGIIDVTDCRLPPRPPLPRRSPSAAAEPPVRSRPQPGRADLRV